jgi:hypothetical protein
MRVNGWFKNSTDFIGAEEVKDFYRKNGKSTGGVQLNIFASVLNAKK